MPLLSVSSTWDLTTPTPLKASTTLAVLYGKQARYDQAEPLLQRALAIRERHLGPDHPDTAQSLNSLAVLYYEQAKYELSQPLLQYAPCYSANDTWDLTTLIPLKASTTQLCSIANKVNMRSAGNHYHNAPLLSVSNFLGSLTTLTPCSKSQQFSHAPSFITSKVSMSSPNRCHSAPLLSVRSFWDLTTLTLHKVSTV